VSDRPIIVTAANGEGAAERNPSVPTPAKPEGALSGRAVGLPEWNLEPPVTLLRGGR
jgi:hypothetical protein